MLKNQSNLSLIFWTNKLIIIYFNLKKLYTKSKTILLKILTVFNPYWNKLFKYQCYQQAAIQRMNEAFTQNLMNLINSHAFSIALCLTQTTFPSSANTSVSDSSRVTLMDFFWKRSELWSKLWGRDCSIEHRTWE